MHAANAGSHMHMLRADVLMHANNGCDLRLIATTDYTTGKSCAGATAARIESTSRTGRDLRTGDEKPYTLPTSRMRAAHVRTR